MKGGGRRARMGECERSARAKLSGEELVQAEPGARADPGLVGRLDDFNGRAGKAGDLGDD